MIIWNLLLWKNKKKNCKIFYFIVKFNNRWPFIEKIDREKYERYYNFLRRDNENIDKAIQYFKQNYFNDIVDNQKEKYLDTLEEKYNRFLKKRMIIEEKVVYL